MRFLLLLLILFSLMSCSDDREQINKQHIRFLVDEYDYLNEQFFYFQKDITYKISVQEKENQEKIKKIGHVFSIAERMLESNHYKVDDANKVLDDSLLHSYYENKKIQLTEYDLGDDSLNHMIHLTNFLKLKLNFYRTFVSKHFGCSSIVPPEVFKIQDKNTVMVLYGMLDTFQLKNKVVITSIEKNGIQTDIPYELEVNQGYSKIKFNTDQKGRYNWEGYYFLPTPKELDSIKINGTFTL